MAFCTSCGATVLGAFCQQCGTPSSAAAGQPAAPHAAPQAAGQSAPQAAPQWAPAAAPVARKTSPIVWILLAVAGVFVLGIVGLIATGLFVAKTVVSNPGLMLGKIIAATNPDAEVLSTDPTSQTIRIRDKKTGEEFTFSFDDVKQGRLKFSAKGKSGEVADMEIGGGEGKLPAWVPAYPGAKAQGNMTARGDSGDGMGEGGVVAFTTPDPPSKVTAFYEAKFKDLGMTVEVTQVGDTGGLIAGSDESGKRTLSVMVGGGSGGDTTMTVTYGRKR